MELVEVEVKAGSMRSTTKSSARRSRKRPVLQLQSSDWCPPTRRRSPWFRKPRAVSWGLVPSRPSSLPGRNRLSQSGAGDDGEKEAEAARTPGQSRHHQTIGQSKEAAAVGSPPRGVAT